MSIIERALVQREVIAQALEWRARDNIPGMIHVYGPKLFGPPVAGEHHCTAERPFNGSQPGPVIFHTSPRLRDWSGAHFCADCGTSSGADVQ